MKKLVWKYLKIIILISFSIVLYTIVFGLVKNIEVTEPYYIDYTPKKSITKPFVCNFIFDRQYEYQDYCGFVRNFNDKTFYVFYPKIFFAWLPYFLLILFVIIFGVLVLKQKYYENKKNNVD
jgi:hypothetical protein